MEKLFSILVLYLFQFLVMHSITILKFFARIIDIVLFWRVSDREDIFFVFTIILSTPVGLLLNITTYFHHILIILPPLHLNKSISPEPGVMLCYQIGWILTIVFEMRKILVFIRTTVSKHLSFRWYLREILNRIVVWHGLLVYWY